MSKILIVDDEPSIRITLRAFLQNDGHTVDVAEDVDGALQLLRQNPYDVVVSDIIMPRVSGIALLQELRKTAPTVQVLIMTGQPNIETAVEAVRAGARDYLVKPVDKASILRTVGNAARIKELEDETRRLQAQNAEYQKGLERMVEERTRELNGALSELKQAQQHMFQQERLSALGQLAGGIAHDFNNCLVPILGLSQFLVTHPAEIADHAETLSIMETIHTASRDATETVKRLREFYAPDERLVVTDVNLATLVVQMRQVTQPRWKTSAEAEGRTIVFETHVAEIPSFRANEARIREILMNLIINAVDAMPRGGTITVSATPVGADWVEIRVSDTGEGMPEEVRRRCLEPFFTTKGERGTGLGLSMVNGIVKRHGGTVEIETRLHEGTTFILRMPVSAHNATEFVDGNKPIPKVAPLRVLVIDDEKWSRQLMARYLKDDGHIVQSAEGGTEGIAMFRADAFDLVITDKAMPRVGGDQVAREIKAMKSTVPIIMLTGSADMVIFRGQRPGGVDAIVAKPATQDDIRKAIASVVGNNTSAS